MDDSSEDALHTSMLSELRKKGSAIDLQPTLILERDSLGTHATLAFLAPFSLLLSFVGPLCALLTFESRPLAFD